MSVYNACVSLKLTGCLSLSVFTPLFSLITSKRKNNILLISNIFICDTTLIFFIKIKEQKKKEERSHILNPLVFLINILYKQTIVLLYWRYLYIFLIFQYIKI